MCVSACERKRVLCSAASAFSVLVWSTLPLSPLCVHGSQHSFHPTVAGDKSSILPSHHWVWKSWSPFIFFFAFLMTSSLWWSQAIFLLKDDYFGDPVMLFTTKVSPEALSSYTLMSSDACFLSVLLFASYSPLNLFPVCDDLLLIPKWTCEHGFFLLPLRLVWHVYVNCLFFWERCKEWWLLDAVCISVQKMYLHLSTALFHVFMHEQHHSSWTKA